MLLRYVVLHGVPRTDADWERFRLWKVKQVDCPECHMADLEAPHGRSGCDKCPDPTGCTKLPKKPA